MTNQEEEYELNYIKIDSKKEIRLLGNEDYGIEFNNFWTSALMFEQEQIGKKLEKSIKSKFPDPIDLLKINYDKIKEFKSMNSDKKSLNSSINRILSTDYKDRFIFSQTNILDICRLLTIGINDLKKYKIQSFKDFKNLLSKIKFEKFDFFKIYANNEYLKNKEKDKIDTSFSHQSSQNKSTTFSSLSGPIKDLFDESSSIDESNALFLNKNHNEPKGIHYIDNNIKNIVFSSMVNNYYNEDNGIKKILTKECFIYPKYNKNSISEKSELPLELILILYKFKNVKTLIFQIQNIEENFIKMAIFIIINANWLFINGISEIKFDLGNDNLQYRINEVFKERATELYHLYQKSKNLIYNISTYKARTINLWEPEADMFFEKENDENSENNKEIKYLYNIQPYEETSTFDNHLCNIYNEFGNLTKLKYIRPINYTYKNKFNLYQNTLNDDFDDSNNNSNSNSNYSMELLNMSVGDLQRLERESISSYSKIVNQKLMSQNTINYSQSNINIDNSINKKTTPQIFAQFAEQKKNKPYFEMIAIYSYSIAKYFKKLAKLSLYFHKPYAYELSLLFALNFDQPHFLIFLNKMENLTDVEFSFNSLDDKSFDYLLGIIYKNSNISSLKMSFFSSDINYCDDSLFNLCSAKKLSLTKIFQDQKEYEIKHQLEKDIKINNFILNTKLLQPFNINLCNFFNLLKTRTINKLKELVLRLDLPIPILENKKYIILIIKFIINILIMLTFQENKIHTLKLLAPQLELNCTIQPYIRQFFKEISLKEEYNEEWEEKLKNEKDKKEKIRMKEKEKELKEQREKEKELNEKKKELKEKKERKELLKSINENISDIPKANDIEDYDNIYEVDVDGNLENFDYYKRFNSVMQKNKFEQAARRKRTITINSEDISNQKRSELNHNICLENLILQFKIYDLPEIFNICIKNNLSGLKFINIGTLDETSFIGFMTSYKKLSDKLKNLTSLKISLGITVLSFANLENYILDYININSPQLQEKYLFSNLQIVNEKKMDELFKLVYFKAAVPKLVIQIGYDNEHLLTKVIYKYILESKTELQSLIMIFMMDKYEKLRVASVLECLSSFYEKKKNKVIICKENPNNTCI